MKNSVLFGLGILTALVLLFLFKKPAIRLLGGYTEIEKTVERDTTYLPIEIDTLEVFNNYVTTHGIILNPEPIIKYKYIKESSPIVIDSTKNFMVSVKDSLIDGQAYVTNDFTGDLLDLKFDYKPLFPKIIEKRIPIKITETITETISNDKSRIGIGIGMNTELTPSLSLDYINKNNFGIEARFSQPNLIDTDNILNRAVIGLTLKKFF